MQRGIDLTYLTKLNESMAITKDDIRDVLKEYGVVTEKNLGEALKNYGVLTEQNLEKSLKSYGVITEKSLGKALKNYGVVTEKRLRTELNKTKRELQTSIANVAFNSPTFNQFNQLERRVGRVEASL